MGSLINSSILQFGGLDGGKCLDASTATATATGIEAHFIAVTSDIVFNSVTLWDALTSTSVPSYIGTADSSQIPPNVTVYAGSLFGSGKGRYFKEISIKSGQLWYYNKNEV